MFQNLINLTFTEKFSRDFHELYFVKYSHNNLVTTNYSNNNEDTKKIQFEGSCMFLEKNYVFLKFEVRQNGAANTQNADANHIFSAVLEPVALFREGKLATTSKKHHEFFEKHQGVCLLHDLITFSAGTIK